MSITERIRELHEAADYVDEFLTAISPTLNRRCEACLGVVYLTQGRHSGKWFYTHAEQGGCRYDRTGARRFFNERQEAIEAIEIWL